MLFGILYFSFLKSVFLVTRIRFRTFGYLLSFLSLALPNWPSPAIYAFALGIFVGWIEVVWPNNFSSWVRQKSWSAMWAVVTLMFFSGFSAAYCSFNTKEKNSADSESNQGPKDVFLHYSPPLYQLSYRQVSGVLSDRFFGEATLYGQFMLVHNSVPACYALVVFFWVILHAFWYPMIFFPEEYFFGHTNSFQDLRISSLNSLLGSSQLTLTSYICFRSRNFCRMNWSCVPKHF